MGNDKIKILAIDDMPDNLVTLKALIKDAFPDALTITALDGATGLEMAATEDPDVILLDIVMPIMDGFEVCEKLKADYRLSDIPVVFITAQKGDRDSRIRALEIGADAFIAKPIDENELTAQIRAMVKIKRANVDKREEKEQLTGLVREQTHYLEKAHLATLNLLEDLKAENEARRNNEEALKKSEAGLADIFQSVTEGIVYTDFSGKVLTINPSLERIIEIPRENIIGKNILDLAVEYFAPENISRVVPILKNIIRGKTIEGFQVEYNNKILEVSSTFNRQTNRVTGVFRDITERIKSERRERQHNRILTALTMDESLPYILDLIVREMQKEDPLSLCSVLLSDEQGEHLLYGAAPNLPDFYNKAINGIKIGNGIGSCGTAAFTGKRVITEDILTDPSWISFLDLAQQANLRACWSEPILSSQNKILGTFAVYYHEPRAPNQKDIERLQVGMDFSRIAIERKRAQEALTESERLLKTSQIVARLGSFVWDISTGLWKSSEILDDIFGIDDNYIRSLDGWAALIHPDWRAIMMDYVINEVIGKRRRFDKEYKVIRQNDGREIWVHGLGELELDNRSQPRILIGIINDITERKKIESQVIQSERLSALGEMSAGMAHEINQPLNTLSILFDNILLEAKNNDFVSKDYLFTKTEKVFKNILRIRNLIDHVREFSRSHEGYVLNLFNINQSILNALSMISEQFRIAGIELDTTFDENLPEIKGNTYKFEQVVLNLISNSKDALLEKKSRLNEAYPMFIRITTQSDHQNICLKVEDNGIGIREDHIDKILQPFFTTKETGKGTGLGLSISYGLVQEMQGKIAVQSKVLLGTTISITIPVKPGKI